MKFIYFFLLINFIIFSNPTSAETVKHNGTWWGTFTKKEIATNLSLWAETQLRYNLSTGGMAQILYRTGLLKKVNTHELGFLYGYIQSNTAKEHRLALQHIKNYKDYIGVNLTSRARLEYRVLENTEETASRFRLLLRYVKNLKYPLVIWDEIFINTQKVSWNGNQTNDRNRLFIGTNFKLNDSTVEYGYLNQRTPRKSRTVSEHIFVLYFNF